MRELLSFPDTQSFGTETGPKSEMGVRRAKAALSSGCKSLCVPKTKSERIDDEVLPRWRVNLWRRIAEPDERPAHPFATTDEF